MLSQIQNAMGMMMAEGIEDYLGSILFTPELAC
jgi:hypothetical protein